MSARHEAVVAQRFDALHARFKRDVPADDPRLVAIVEHLGALSGRRVLDLGCGKGRFARSLIERGAVVIGLDLSAAMLAGAGGLDRVRASARRLPFPPASFDAVIAVETFEHLAPDSIDRVCDEVRRVLRGGGIFLIVDKNVGSWNARRPWLPSVAVKWIDECRGRFMYTPSDKVREHWFRPRGLCRRLKRFFPSVRFVHLLAPTERHRFPFQYLAGTRLFVLWAAQLPGGSA